MAIPNTTPTPNELYNGEMKKMSDTELRVVLVVTRHTLGWLIDEKTGMRKKEDWISYFQLKQQTGRGYTALSEAIDNCIKNGWIEARDEQGNILDTKEKRHGKKIFYRLGRIFLDKIEGKQTSSESEKVKLTSSESELSESELSESGAYKRKTITKEKLLQKEYVANATEPFSFESKLNQLISSKDKKLQIIGLYWKFTGIAFPSKEAFQAGLHREFRPAKNLIGYPLEQIISIFDYLDFIEKNEGWLEKWTLETVHKFIDRVNWVPRDSTLVENLQRSFENKNNEKKER